MRPITLDEVTRSFQPIFPSIPGIRQSPTYRPVQLAADVGAVTQERTGCCGGTGIIGQTIKTLFPLDRVVSVDTENRFLPGLDIETFVTMV